MDTTVILAQPRVPRLRADAVYVANRACLGSVGHAWASAEIDSFVSIRNFRRPPLGVQSHNKSDAEQVRKSDLNKGEISRLLAAQTQGFLHIRSIS